MPLNKETKPNLNRFSSVQKRKENTFIFFKNIFIDLPFKNLSTFQTLISSLDNSFIFTKLSFDVAQA